MHMYFYNLYMHLNICIYGCVWPYLLIYTLFWHPTGVQGLFTVHLHPGSWCVLHQADTDMVQPHPTSLKKVVVPAQLPRHMDK